MPGPQKDLKSIKEVLAYRKTIDKNTGKPLSFRQIGRLMDKDVNQIHRWFMDGVDQLSTEKRKKVLTR